MQGQETGLGRDPYGTAASAVSADDGPIHGESRRLHRHTVPRPAAGAGPTGQAVSTGGVGGGGGASGGGGADAAPLLAR
jgi:hypothetical protein